MLAFSATLVRAYEAIAVAQGVVVIAQAIGDFGLSQAAVRALPAGATRQQSDATALAAGAVVVFATGAVVATVLAVGSTWLMHHAARPATLLVAPAAGMPVLSSGADALLRSRAHYARPVLLVSISRFAGFSSVPVASISGSAQARRRWPSRCRPWPAHCPSGYVAVSWVQPTLTAESQAWA